MPATDKWFTIILNKDHCFSHAVGLRRGQVEGAPSRLEMAVTHIDILGWEEGDQTLGLPFVEKLFVNVAG